MTVNEIIAQIEALPPDEQAKVVQYAYRLDAERQLSGAELTALAQRMVSAIDPAEIALLRNEIAHGFYGSDPHA